MSENLIIKGDNKKELYENLLPQIKSLLEGETDEIANMANVSACLKDTFNFWWVGFYRVIDNELVLGPFQGPLACTRIRKGKGVCGTAWQEAKTQIVPDVDAFPGHIACSSLTRSEIVVPVIKNGVVKAVLDIDSERLNTFDAIDQRFLEEIASIFAMM
jgi:GAF domain-containing protein